MLYVAKGRLAAWPHTPRCQGYSALSYWCLKIYLCFSKERFQPTLLELVLIFFRPIIDSVYSIPNSLYFIKGNTNQSLMDMHPEKHAKKMKLVSKE